MNVVWLRRANRSLEKISDYIALDNPQAAYAMVVRLREAAAALGHSPGMGRPGRVAGTRELVVPGTLYLIPYRVKGDTVQILHVLHGARKWPKEF